MGSTFDGHFMRIDIEFQSKLIPALLQPSAYSHPTPDIRHVETHISHIILAGDFAYKIKKAIDLGFLDYSTLVKRHYFCNEELRLNGRLAPDVYLSTVAITGTLEQPMVEGTGAAIEFAVKMRRFPQADLLDRRQIDAEIVDRLAVELARFHQLIPVAAVDSPYGTDTAVIQPMQENFNHLGRIKFDAREKDQLKQLKSWTLAKFQQLSTKLERRKRTGFIRECHGDMHLGNIVLVDGKIIIFDGIEFNPALRWIDVMSEVAFLTMDLEHRGDSELGWRLLDHYLQLTGDYEGLALLRFYQVYRALVRAKVAAIEFERIDGVDSQAKAFHKCESYIELAKHLSRTRRSGLIITTGVSGTGKTTLTQALLERLPAIRIRSDVERKRLHGHSPQMQTAADIDKGIYGAHATELTYRRLLELSRTITAAGFTLIVDATFLLRRQRSLFIEFADNADLPLLILELDAPVAILRERVLHRQAEGQDASDAGIEVLTSQLDRRDPLSEKEKERSTRIDTSVPFSLAPVLSRWKQIRHRFDG